MKNLTHQDFIDAGYRGFTQKGVRGYTDEGLQKKITDKEGIRYFITVFVYDNREYKKILNKDYSFEPDVQFSTENCVNVQLLSPESVEEIETKLDTIWRALGCPYYERY